MKVKYKATIRISVEDEIDEEIINKEGFDSLKITVDEDIKRRILNMGIEDEFTHVDIESTFYKEEEY